MSGGKRAGFLSAVVAGATVAGVTLAQVADEGGLRLTFNFDTTARVDDNFNLTTPSQGTSSFVTHTLGFDLLSETRTQRLAAGASGVIRWGEIKGSNSATGFDQPRIYFDYDREAANARFGVDGEYTETNVAFLRLSEDIGEEFDPTDLITDQGTLQRTRFGTSLELGLNGPLGASFDVSQTRRDYTDVTDPELVDTRETNVSASLRLEFSPVLTGRIDASLRDYSADDAIATDRETRRFGIGLEGDIGAAMRFDLSLGHERIETAQTTGTTVDSGMSGALLLTRDLPDGAVTAELANSFSTNGNRTTLTFGRVMELPRGQLSAELGAARQEGTSRTYIVGSLAYTHEFSATDTLTANLSRDVQTSSDEEVLQITQLSASYRRQVTELSGLGLSLTYIDSNYIVGPVTSLDRTRGNLQLTYDRQLTRDWVLTGGLEHRFFDEEGSARASGNAVFMTLNKSFDILP